MMINLWHQAAIGSRLGMRRLSDLDTISGPCILHHTKAATNAALQRRHNRYSPKNSLIPSFPPFDCHRFHWRERCDWTCETGEAGERSFRPVSAQAEGR